MICGATKKKHHSQKHIFRPHPSLYYLIYYKND